MPLVNIEEYRETFSPKSRPCVATVKNWIKKGKLPYEQIGRIYYIRLAEESKKMSKFTGNPLVDQVLRDSK